MNKGLDAIDKKLLYTLDFDARMSYAQLGKKLALSKQVVKYRIEQLQKKSIIQGFYVDINPSKLGLQIYLVYFTFSRFSLQKEKEFIYHISKQKAVGVITSLQGKWNFCIGIWAKDIMHFKDCYRTIMKEYEQYVTSKTIMIETDFYYYKPKQLSEKKEERELVMHGDTDPSSLNNIDRQLLRLLSTNCRVSLVALSEQIGLTANAVKKRMKNLEKKKIILGYRVMINYQLLGYLHYRVFLHLQNITEQKERSIITYLKHQKEVISVTKTIGYCELEFRTVVSSVQEFYTFMEQFRNQFSESMKDYEEILYYKFHTPLNYFPF